MMHCLQIKYDILHYITSACSNKSLLPRSGDCRAVSVDCTFTFHSVLAIDVSLDGAAVKRHEYTAIVGAVLP